MPYELTQVSPRRFYVSNTVTGGRYSKKPLSKKVALRQLHAIRNASEEEVGAGFFDWMKKAGSAVVDRVKAVVGGPREDFGPKIRDFLKKVGGHTIERLLVCRTPVEGFLTGAMNAISFGRFGKAMAAEGIEGVFHLSLICEYKDGKSLKHCVLEKNEVLNISNKITNKEYAEFLPVDMDHHPTIDQFIANTRAKVSDKQFFLYEAFSTNCQAFILDLLLSNGFLTPDLKSFIHQDAAALGRHMGQPYKAVFGALTNAGAIADVAINGRGLDIAVHHVLCEMRRQAAASGAGVKRRRKR